MKRSQFLRSVTAIGVAGSAIPLYSFSADREASKLDKKLVEEFVRVSHGKMDKVKPLLEEYPTLLNAAHDWQGGDFETGLGAASHIGDKELVRYFIEKGAQANIFTACLFGKIEIVKPMLTAYPSVIHAKGPHGFTLLHHAEKGGEEALEVKKFLESLGAEKTRIPLY